MDIVSIHKSIYVFLGEWRSRFANITSDNIYYVKLEAVKRGLSNSHSVMHIVLLRILLFFYGVQKLLLEFHSSIFVLAPARILDQQPNRWNIKKIRTDTIHSEITTYQFGQQKYS